MGSSAQWRRRGGSKVPVAGDRDGVAVVAAAQLLSLVGVIQGLVPAVRRPRRSTTPHEVVLMTFGTHKTTIVWLFF